MIQVYLYNFSMSNIMINKYSSIILVCLIFKYTSINVNTDIINTKSYVINNVSKSWGPSVFPSSSEMTYLVSRIFFFLKLGNSSNKFEQSIQRANNLNQEIVDSSTRDVTMYANSLNNVRAFIEVVMCHRAYRRRPPASV